MTLFHSYYFGAHSFGGCFSLTNFCLKALSGSYAQLIFNFHSTSDRFTFCYSLYTLSINQDNAELFKIIRLKSHPPAEIIDMTLNSVVLAIVFKEMVRWPRSWSIGTWCQILQILGIWDLNKLAYPFERKQEFSDILIFLLLKVLIYQWVNNQILAVFSFVLFSRAIEKNTKRKSRKCNRFQLANSNALYQEVLVTMKSEVVLLHETSPPPMKKTRV